MRKQSKKRMIGLTYTSRIITTILSQPILNYLSDMLFTFHRLDQNQTHMHYRSYHDIHKKDLQRNREHRHCYY